MSHYTYRYTDKMNTTVQTTGSENLYINVRISDDDKAHSIFFGFVDKITFDNRPQIYMHNSILGTRKKCFKTRGSPGYKSTFYYPKIIYIQFRFNQLFILLILCYNLSYGSVGHGFPSDQSCTA